MAFDIKPTDHLYVPFNRFNRCLNDSKHNARTFKSKEHMERYCRYDDGSTPVFDDIAHRGYSYYVEYVPIVHAKAVRFEDEWMCCKCGKIQHVSSIRINSPLDTMCKRCNAVLDFEKKGTTDGK